MTGDRSGVLGDGGAGTDAWALLGAHALDAVDDVERRAVDRLAAADPEIARELAGLRATAAMLGAAAATPPPAGLRAAVLAEIRRTPQLGSPAARAAAGPLHGAGPRLRAGTPRRTVWLAVAATALGAAAVPSAVAWRQVQQTNRVEQQAQQVADVLAEPGARVVRAEVAAGGTAVGVLATDRAVFTATGLDDPGAGKVYQLWVIRGGKPLPDAVLADDAGRVRAVTDDFAVGDGLAVTIEPAGGSRTPTSAPVVVLQPT